MAGLEKLQSKVGRGTLGFSLSEVALECTMKTCSSVSHAEANQ
jgi:hypothetical protein